MTCRPAIALAFLLAITSCGVKSVEQRSALMVSPTSDSMFGIRNGDRLSSSEYPYVGLIAQASTGAMICSGSLLSPHIVLTAAHCLHRKLGSRTVRIDARDLYFTNDIAIDAEQVLRAHIHPDYDYEARAPQRSDIAILELRYPVVASTYARITPLNPMERFHLATAVGWGVDQTGQAVVKRKGDLYVSPWPSTSFTHLEGVPTTTDQITCEGDSGGAVVLPGSHTIVGIVHSGSGTDAPTAGERCANTFIAYYTNPQHYYEWVAEKVSSRIRNPDALWRHDVNGDGQVGTGDLVAVQTMCGNLYDKEIALPVSERVCDFNLDGQWTFGTSDLVSLFQSGVYETGPHW